MANYRKAGRWVLLVALSTAPSTGCKNGVEFPIWNPFAKPVPNGPILDRDSDGGYLQAPTTTVPTPAPPEPRGEEFGWTAPFKKFGDTISSPFKKSAEKPKPKVAEDDPVSLTSKHAPPGPSLYVSLAKLQEKAGKNESALEEYAKALELDAKHLPALLGVARLYDRLGEYDKAITAYNKAIDAHPDSAAAFNDLGLCYARANKLSQSVSALERAVAIDAEKPLYRNNLATVLVEVGRSEEAYRVLIKAHGEAIAHYNVGFLLNKRGHKQKALEQFKLAAKSDPNFAPAKQWIDLLGRDATAPALDSKTTQIPAVPVISEPVVLPPATTALPKTDAVAAPPQIPVISSVVEADLAPLSPTTIEQDATLATPIPSPIVLPGRNEPKFSSVSQPRVIEEQPREQGIEKAPLPTLSPANKPIAMPPTDKEIPADALPSAAPAETGPKLLGNEQARRSGAATAGDRYFVGDRYSTPLPTTGPVAAMPTAPMPRRPAALPPLPEQISKLPTKPTPPAAARSEAPPSVPSTAGARYPASRY